jgi:diaminopropionate ammonia-lyase
LRTNPEAYRRIRPPLRAHVSPAASETNVSFSPNSAVQPTLDGPGPSRAPLAFHRSLPGYAPTPLRSLPALAERCGVSRVWLKDESDRLGLPAFKVLGASWAAAQTLAARVGEPALAGDTAALRARMAAAPGAPAALVAATDGNHGRAVARTAALLGLPARIFLPAGAAPARLAAIVGEGARVEEVDGTYDDAVARAAAVALEVGGLLLQDTGFPGYEEIPDRIAEGYATLFWELEAQLAEAGENPPDLALVQVGVGALAQAAVVHWKRPGGPGGTRVVGVEPTEAACVLAALEAGEVVTLPGSQHSLMAGLNCGTASTTAWPWLRRGLDGIVTVPDERAVEAMRALAAAGVVAGETGAAGVAGLLELVADDEARRALMLGPETRVLLLSTEGATDPESWRRIVGRDPANG